MPPRRKATEKDYQGHQAYERARRIAADEEDRSASPQDELSGISHRKRSPLQLGKGRSQTENIDDPEPPTPRNLPASQPQRAAPLTSSQPPPQTEQTAYGHEPNVPHGTTLPGVASLDRPILHSPAMPRKPAGITPWKTPNAGQPFSNEHVEYILREHIPRTLYTEIAQELARTEQEISLHMKNVPASKKDEIQPSPARITEPGRPKNPKRRQELDEAKVGYEELLLQLVRDNPSWDWERIAARMPEWWSPKKCELRHAYLIREETQD